MTVSPDQLTRGVGWLRDNPEFNERPASMREFLGPPYLNIEEGMRESVLETLVDMFGEEVSPIKPATYREAIYTGAVGIGKTTVASIVLPYLVHWILCLRDPQDHFNLLPGSRIAFMMMSTTSAQARQVLFSDVKARMAYSPWFKNHLPDPAFKNQIRFPDKDIWILPGDSQEVTFEGYNILGGIIDEADSHKITEHKDYAEEGLRTISNRISSRFGDKGFLLIIGQMKGTSGFAARKYKEYMERTDTYAARMTIWESMGEDFYRDPSTGEIDYFYYDTDRKEVVPSEVVDMIGTSETMLAIPVLYEPNFDRNPEEALKDLAGIPPSVDSPFISLSYRIGEATETWAKSGRFGGASPVKPDGSFTAAFIAKRPDLMPRHVHVDVAYAEGGDSMAIAMGHVDRVVEDEGELKPNIVIDFVWRKYAPPGSEVFLSEARNIIYALADRGYRIKNVTYDSYQSVDSVQQLRRKGFKTSTLSVDREKAPYLELKDAIYSGRIELPPYMTGLNRVDPKPIDIIFKELSELKDTGRKIDHPPSGSKDVADCLAAVAYILMKTSKRSNLGGNDFDMVVDRRNRPTHHSFNGNASGSKVRNDFLNEFGLR